MPFLDATLLLLVYKIAWTFSTLVSFVSKGDYTLGNGISGLKFNEFNCFFASGNPAETEWFVIFSLTSFLIYGVGVTAVSE